jgi:amino acid permease
MMAIPKALMLLGLLPGLGIMVLMAALTFFTLAGLVSASSSTGMGAGTSYGALVRRTVGATADKTLQVRFDFGSAPVVCTCCAVAILLP